MIASPRGDVSFAILFFSMSAFIFLSDYMGFCLINNNIGLCSSINPFQVPPFTTFGATDAYLGIGLALLGLFALYSTNSLAIGIGAVSLGLFWGFNIGFRGFVGIGDTVTSYGLIIVGIVLIVQGLLRGKGEL